MLATFGMLLLGTLLNAMIVAAVHAQASGTKILYVYDNLTLTRTPQTANTTTPVTIAGGGGFQDWSMTPVIPTGESLTLSAGIVTIPLILQATGDNTPNKRPITVELRTNTGTIATSAVNDFDDGPELVSFTIAVPQTTLAAGDYLVMRVHNDEFSGGGNPLPARTITVSQKSALGNSQLSFATSTVVNVDSVSAYSAAYPASATQPLYDDGETVYLRAVVSDPFGSADVSGATLGLTDAGSTVLFSNATMTQVASTAASKTYEYAYTLQAGSVDGSWSASVTGNEGSEGTISHTANGSFNVGVPQLAVAKSDNGDFIAGGNGSYSIVVHNNGPPLTGTTTVTDTLDASLGYVSGTGTGWDCSASSGQNVSCANAAALANGADLPTLTLAVTVAGSAPNSVDNFATVAHPSVNGGAGQAGNTDIAVIAHPDLSEESGKAVLDLNGGDADPGDTLRYTITLTESGGTAATGVSVTDDIPASVTGFSVVSVPVGSTDSSTGGGGANGTGLLNVTGISVPASSSVTIVFDVIVAGSAVPGDQIANSATVTNPNGPDATPAAPTVTVSQSQAAGSGNKTLYIYDNLSLTRTVQAADTITPVAIPGSNGSSDWTLTPAIAAGKSLVLDAGNIVAQVVMAAANNGTNNARPVTLELRANSGTIATSSSVDVVGAATNLYNFTITVPQTTLLAGDQLVLRIHNNLPANTGREVAVYQQVTGKGNSKLTFATSTVVNVDSVAIYSGAYPAVTTQSIYIQGDTLYVRAVISDPFGSADVGSANVTLTDSSGVMQANDAAMTMVADSGVATRTFEYQYTVPANADLGFWTASVTGHEGTEGTVSHTANLAFGVGVSTLSVLKSHVGNFNAGGNGSYSLVVSNNSPGDIAGSTTVTDTLDTNLTYVSGTGTGWNCSASSGQNVSCSNAATILATSDLPTLALAVAVAGSAPATVDNAAAVSNPNVDGGSSQAGNVDTATIVHPDLSTSTKDVVDLDGGDADPGDTLRYTIVLTESAGAPVGNVSVSDTMPVLATFGGAIGVSSTCGGTDGSNASQVSVTGISLAASGHCTVVFDVTVAGSAVPGDNIDNTATVTNPIGADATPAARTVTVSQSQTSASGNKLLYVYDNQELTRTEQAANSVTPVTIVGGGTAFADWSMTPVIPVGKTLTLNVGDVIAQLVIAATNNGPTNPRPVTVELRTSTGTIATSASVNVSGASTTTTNLYNFTITVPETTLLAGDQLVMRVHNNDGGGGRHIAVYQKTASNGRSTVSLATSTVINVDSVGVFSAAYPAVTTQPTYVHGDTIYLRAVVSDPFGSADVNRATLTLTDSAATAQLSSVAMTQVVAAATAASKTFEYAYIVPATAKLGSWTASITGHEGTENTITHTGNAPFELRGTITLSKAWVNATAGDAVSLAITGGTGATAGTSIAPATTTAAIATSTASASITLTEAFTTGSAANYTVALGCVKDSDASVVAVTGTALSRSIVMPVDSSVTCTYTNTTTVPLTMIKLSQVASDPINGPTNPKAVPGALVDYLITIMNPAPTAIDVDTVVIDDPVPANVELFVGDLGDLGAAGSGPVAFTDGTMSSGLSYIFSGLDNTDDDVEFSSNGLDYSYEPLPDGDGFDAAVSHIRINPKGVFNTDNATFTIKLRVRVE